MIYSALVMDNSDFLKTGTIRVRIQNYYMGKMNWDLSDSPSDIADGFNENSKTYSDFNAFVYSPLGGGKNYGLFFLPEVNTQGIVAFTGNAIERGTSCFWLGTLFKSTFDKDGVLQSINIPSDKISANGVATDGFVGGKTNMQSNNQNVTDFDGSLVLRLKTTAITKDTDGKTIKPDPLNWDKRNTDNLVVLNKSNIIVRHSSSYDDKQNELAYQELNISPDGISATMSSKTSSSTEARTSKINLANVSDSLSFSLKVNDPIKKTSSTILAVDNTISITSAGSNTSSITLDDTGIVLNFNNTASITTGNNGDVILNSKNGKIYIVGGAIHMGQGNNRILTTNSGSGASYNTGNGMIITASDSVYA